MWRRADGLVAFDGWSTSPRIEALRAAWRDAGSLDEQRRICVELQVRLWQDVRYIPMGEYWQSTAYRKDLLRGVLGHSPSLTARRGSHADDHRTGQAESGDSLQCGRRSL
jgi:hypothetical protein